MKIRNRITYSFTGGFSVILLIISILIFYQSKQTLEDNFLRQLEQRLAISEQFMLESNQLESELKSKLVKEFSRTLDNEIEIATKRNDLFTNLQQEIDIKKLNANISAIDNGQTVHWKKDRTMAIAKKYVVDEEPYVVIVQAEDNRSAEYLSELRMMLLIIFLVGIGLALAISFSLSRNVLKPISSKIKKANSIKANNLNQRLTVYNEKDELGMLAISFNGLLDRLQEAIELEKNFVRYASHELSNPLATIIGESEHILNKERTTNEYIDSLKRITINANKIDQLIQHFLKLSKLEANQIQKSEVSIDIVLFEAISETTRDLDDQRRIEVSIENELKAEDLVIRCNKLLLVNVFGNVIDNALKYSEEDILINVTKKTHPEVLQIMISDQGIGIEPEHIEKIFQPLYRVRPADETQGTGIGLSFARKIIELHDGKIRIEPRKDRGTKVIIELPSSQI